MLKSAFAVLFLASTASSQTAPNSSPDPNPDKPQIETTISLGVAAQLTTTRVQIAQDGVNTQALNPSAAVLGTIRQSFKPWLGYTVNLGYTRTRETSTGPSLGYNAPYLAIPVNAYETSLTWHLQHHITPRLTGFVDVGAGALTFLPTHSVADAKNFVLYPSVTLRPLGVASLGIDYRLHPHLSLRVEYRALIYKYPDFGSTVGRTTTLTSQPTLSLVYQFGHKH